MASLQISNLNFVGNICSFFRSSWLLLLEKRLNHRCRDDGHHWIGDHHRIGKDLAHSVPFLELIAAAVAIVRSNH